MTQVVEQWLPTLETNAAQDDAEVLDVLLRQLGYRPSLAEEVQSAWLAGIAQWRGKKAVDERNLNALRAFVEMGSLPADAELPPELANKPTDLINATLGQFDVPAEMSPKRVLKEVLKELDMDTEDVRARRARAVPPRHASGHAMPCPAAAMPRPFRAGLYAVLSCCHPAADPRLPHGALAHMQLTHARPCASSAPSPLYSLCSGPVGGV